MARSEVPASIVTRLQEILDAFPECRQESAWTGERWRVGTATVAHVFGGEDQRTRVTFRAEIDEAMAFRHLGEPYFVVGWSNEVVGMVIDEQTDFGELRELLTDSYCIMAPQRLSAQVERPALG